MSDSDFVDVGDELVVRIAGYPVAKGKIYKLDLEKAYFICYDELGHSVYFNLPLNFKDYNTVDGVAHNATST